MAAPDSSDESEVVDGLPVLARAPVSPATPSPRAIARSAGVVMPAVQAAAVAAGGFVAGAAVVGLVHRRQRHSPAIAKGRGGRRGLGRGARTASGAGELLQIVSSRSLLLDVHLLGPAGDR
jgi:hypothetical protein